MSEYDVVVVVRQDAESLDEAERFALHWLHEFDHNHAAKIVRVDPVKPKLNRTKRFYAQVAHIREHQRLFDELQGGKNVNVEQYMADYGDLYRWDLYQLVCGDMGIEAKPEICHPNPED